MDPKKQQRGKKRGAPTEASGETTIEDKPAKMRLLSEIPQTDRILRRKPEKKEVKEDQQEKRKERKEPKKRTGNKLSQAELLAEAKAMEAENLRAYEEMKRIEEEKKKPPPKRKPITGPKVTVTTNDKGSFLTLENFKQMPEEVSSVAAPYPVPSFCAVTGQRAKYRDSLTGKPYSTLEAFKIIREKYNKEQAEKLGKDGSDQKEKLSDYSEREFQPSQAELVDEEAMKTENTTFESAQQNYVEEAEKEITQLDQPRENLQPDNTSPPPFGVQTDSQQHNVYF